MTPQSSFPEPHKKHSPYSGEVTQRDMDILRQIGEQTAYRFDQLPGLLARHPDSHSKNPTRFSASYTRDVLRSWQQLGLADYRELFRGNQSWIWLTRQGLRKTRVQGEFFEPSPDMWNSLYWINETWALIEDTYGTYPGFSWESRRSQQVIRERWHIQQKENSSLVIPLEYRGQHLPSALLRYSSETSSGERASVSAVEIVVSKKSYPSWKKIFLELLNQYMHVHLPASQIVSY